MKVIPVRNWLQLKQFCQFQTLSPPASPSELFNSTFNPVMNHLNYQCFLALENEQIIGRIAAVKDQLNPRPAEGFFSGLEVLNHPLAAQKLLQAAADHLRQKGCKIMLGPATWNSNQQVGIVIEGKASLSQPGLPCHPPYYSQLLEQAGLQKLTDLLSFHWYRASGFPRLTARIARRASRNPQVKLQKFNFTGFSQFYHGQ
ncbi:MAG: hypothetical protein MJ157_02250, partial [Clostridia bacterium]|nr:hypothetical protein [Clostridia bacterium]